MRTIALALVLGGALAAPARAQAPQPPVTVEGYYRARPGSAEEFLRLFRKNHLPLLQEMQRRGFVRSIRIDQPFLHAAGPGRWDYRVTIVYRDGNMAVSDPEWDREWAAARERLFPDARTHEAEENARFALLEDHWDLIVNEVTPP